MARKPKILSEKDEKKKLTKIIAALPQEKRKIAEGLIDDAAFMLGQCVTLKEQLREKGCVEEYQNGKNQSGKKQSAAFQAYVNLQKSYLATMKQLNDMIPEKAESVPGKELMEFISK